MRKNFRISHKFVDQVPNRVEESTLYISIEYATAIHKCFCGCGSEVVTPFSPSDWQLMYDGLSVSLNPSIGNWSFKCRSHYWIRSNEVVWAADWSKKRVENARSEQRRSKEQYFASEQEKLNLGAAKGMLGKFWRRMGKPKI
jgi:hypothetical protein